MLLFLPLFFKAETDPQLFLEKFNNADLKNKVRLVASVPFAEIKDIYPQIKDTLDKVKSLVYMRSQSKEAKFLLAVNKTLKSQVLFSKASRNLDSL